MKRIGTIAICLLTIVLMANKCKKEGSSATTNEEMSSTVSKDVLEKIYGQEWFHSREEDKDGILTYRDKSYSFPPSRGGREGFMLEKGGVFYDYGPGPADRPTTTKGTWTMAEGDGGVKVKLTKNGVELSYTLELVSLKDNILKLKKIDN